MEKRLGVVLSLLLFMMVLEFELGMAEYET